mgnify:CR=1 FL=1
MNQERPIQQIIEEIGETLKKVKFQNGEQLSLEVLSKRIGMKIDDLYDWLVEDEVFLDAFEKLKGAKRNDPFEGELGEKDQVQALLITILIIDLKDRHRGRSKLRNTI